MVNLEIMPPLFHPPHLCAALVDAQHLKTSTLWMQKSSFAILECDKNTLKAPPWEESVANTENAQNFRIKMILGFVDTDLTYSRRLSPNNWMNSE